MTRSKRRHRAAAAVELAVLMPVLILLLLAGLDLSRILFAYATITTCARNGAIYASDPTAAAKSPYANVFLAAIADGSSLSNPKLTISEVSTTNGGDAYGDYVQVKVLYRPTTMSGIFRSLTISRTIRMRVAPTSPG